MYDPVWLKYIIKKQFKVFIFIIIKSHDGVAPRVDLELLPFAVRRRERLVRHERRRYLEAGR